MEERLQKSLKESFVKTDFLYEDFDKECEYAEDAEEIARGTMVAVEFSAKDARLSNRVYESNTSFIKEKLALMDLIQAEALKGEVDIKLPYSIGESIWKEFERLGYEAGCTYNSSYEFLNSYINWEVKTDEAK